MGRGKLLFWESSNVVYRIAGSYIGVPYLGKLPEGIEESNSKIGSGLGKTGQLLQAGCGV